MSLSADSLLDRMKLKQEIFKWRSLAIFALFVALLVVVYRAPVGGLSSMGQEFVARIEVSGIIVEDKSRANILKGIAKNDKVKALIVYINSPGGTIVGGENLFKSLKNISKNKPVVAVLGSMATSGGYMAAIAADRIFAGSGTITGSIGVIMQTAEVTDLAKKIGVEFLTFKSSELKGTPSPFQKLTPKVSNAINDSIADSYEFFVELVRNNRPLSEVELNKVVDGRIFTGRQAVKNKLVDQLGSEEDALQWLKNEKNVASSIKIRDIDTKRRDSLFNKMYSTIVGDDTYLSSLRSNGIMALWSPTVF